MEDLERVRAYSISIFMLSLLDEYGKLERLGAFAKVYNTIVKKNSIFETQIEHFKRKKRKKISNKSKLYLFAVDCSKLSWVNVIKNYTATSISVGNTIANLFRLNARYLMMIYGLTEADFIRINKQSIGGVTIPSCRMARLLTEELEATINENKEKI